MAAARPKITWLTQEQLRKAETLFGMFRDSGTDLLEVGRHFIRNPPKVTVDKSWDDGLKEFSTNRSEHLSKSHLASCTLHGRRFGKWLTDTKRGNLISGITSNDVLEWLRSMNIGKKSWNNYRGDLSGIFEWFMVGDRKWAATNPVSEVVFFKKKSMPSPPRKRLEVSHADALMTYLEREKPHWCTFFAVALFAGIRPDMLNGEMSKLAMCVGRDGVDRYFHKDVIFITEEIAKTNEEREVKIHGNLKRWLEKYPPTEQSLCPGDKDEYALIRAMFNIPHDGLRHTAISAFVARYGSFADAAEEFGNSEKIIRRHYNRRMTAAEWKAYYAICPRTVRSKECVAA
jgi:hypothetical protein